MCLLQSVDKPSGYQNTPVINTAKAAKVKTSQAVKIYKDVTKAEVRKNCSKR